MKRKVTLALSSVFGLGYLPKAPGTWGTLGALPIWWLAAELPLWGFLILVAAVFVFSVWISELAEKIYGSHDASHIVIDEVAGMLVAAIGVPFVWQQILPAFVLFRLLDATKPWPIRWLDRRVGGGLGVVVDDIVAGAVACGLMHGARFLYGGWW